MKWGKKQCENKRKFYSLKDKNKSKFKQTKKKLKTKQVGSFFARICPLSSQLSFSLPSVVNKKKRATTFLQMQRLD